MKKYMKVLSVLMAVIMAFSLTSCGTRRKSQNKTIKIGVLLYDEADTFLKGILNEMISQAKSRSKSSGKKYEITITVGDASGDQSQQNDQVRDMISNGCDVLAINLVDRTDPTSIINLAKNNDVPIVFFNRELVKHDLERWNKLYYVGASAEQSGVMQGEEIADYFKKHKSADKNGDGRIQYVILKGEQNHQDTIIRSEKVISTLEDCGLKLERLSGEVANWSRAQAENRMQQLINEYGRSIELVICNNDDMALGALDAYKKKNYTEASYPAVFGIDGTTEALKDVVKGQITGTVFNNARAQADKIMDLSVALARGQDVSAAMGSNEKSFYIRYEKITKENVDDFL